MGAEREHQWQSVSTILGHNDYVKGCAFRCDGKMLATASRDKSVRYEPASTCPAEAINNPDFFCGQPHPATHFHT